MAHTIVMRELDSGRNKVKKWLWSNLIIQVRYIYRHRIGYEHTVSWFIEKTYATKSLKWLR